MALRGRGRGRGRRLAVERISALAHIPSLLCLRGLGQSRRQLRRELFRKLRQRQHAEVDLSRSMRSRVSLGQSCDRQASKSGSICCTCSVDSKVCSGQAELASGTWISKDLSADAMAGRRHGDG